MLEVKILINGRAIGNLQITRRSSSPDGTLCIYEVSIMPWSEDEYRGKIAIPHYPREGAA